MNNQSKDDYPVPIQTMLEFDLATHAGSETHSERVAGRAFQKQQQQQQQQQLQHNHTPTS